MPVRAFRPPRWLIAINAVAAVAFVIASVALYRSQGWTWLTIGSVALTAFAVAGLADAMTCRVELHDEKLVIVNNLLRREYPRDSFTKATWGKGVPVALERAAGGWLRLPEIIPGGLGVANSCNAWIRFKYRDERKP